MRILELWKGLVVAVITLCLNVPAAMAGATNQGNNTSATPGEGSATTTTPASPDSSDRGTKNM